MQNAGQTIRENLCHLWLTDLTVASVRAVPNVGTAAESVQPITTETVPSPGSAIVNPAVVASNGLVRYTIDVVPPGIPDSDIEWSIIEGAGNIQFYHTGNKGRAVNVQGKALGGFKLEADVAGMTLNPKPYIYGRVEEQTVTPLHFFVICDASGTPSMTLPQIETMVTNANHYGRQLAMSFTKGSVTVITNNAWFDVPNVTILQSMFLHTSNVGGLEVYCVNSFWDGDYGKSLRVDAPFVSPGDGIAVAADHRPNTLMHEILHACGLRDISYVGGVGLADKLVDKEHVGADNWSGGAGTGYYPSDLLHRDLIKRLIMCVPADGTEADIPIGVVKGFGAPGDFNWTVVTERYVGVGWWMNSNPQH